LGLRQSSQKPVQVGDLGRVDVTEPAGFGGRPCGQGGGQHA
jgi:hypothetical protein